MAAVKDIESPNSGTMTPGGHAAAPTGGGSRRKPVQVIEMHMMDKRKYLPLTLTSGFTIRALLYPFTLIKTRLQLQKHDAMYRGTFDALNKIARAEGARGLYKGFWVTNLFIVPQMSYIATYESVRYLLAERGVTNNKIKSLVGGGCASMVGQTFVVPIDVVSQHIMMITDNKKDSGKTSGGPRPNFRTPLELPQESLNSPFGRSVAVVKAIYRKDGVRGFYKGYLASLAVYAPNSAMWWFFYDVYTGVLSNCLPDWTSHLAMQTMAAPMSGITTAFFTNPLDTVRARIQVEGTPFRLTATTLWQEERMRIFTKGLSARLVQSVTFSFFIILCYESIKRISLLDDYKHMSRW